MMKLSTPLFIALILWKAQAFQLAPNVARSTATRLSSISSNGADATIRDGRRSFVRNGLVAAASLAVQWNLPLPALADATPDYKAVLADIAALIKDKPDWGPTFVRLSWHSSGTYDKMSKTGGSGHGTIRFKEELVHGGNAGLGETTVPWMEPIYKKYAADGLSYADLYTLGGVTAIKSLGGPTIPWSSGRVDEMDPSAVTPDGRLPNADSGPPGADQSDADHLRDIFYRMGFNDQEIVCLSGAHALGRCHTTASGYDGPWSPTPTTFNNAYYTLLSGLKWEPKEWDGPFQYVNAPAGQLMMLPTDLILIQDKSFLNWVNIYAKDSDRFNKDFTKAYQKLEELGTSDLTPAEWA